MNICNASMYTIPQNIETFLGGTGKGGGGVKNLTFEKKNYLRVFGRAAYKCVHNTTRN